jgi:hypothetical protein
MLDVRGSRELQATILALRQSEREIRLNINKTARSKIRPVWQAELGARARTRLERRVIAQGARATASDRGVQLVAATRTRPLAGGLQPAWDWAGVEFGAKVQRIRVRQRSRGGRPYTRPLTINRQFKPRQRYGMVAFDAASKTGTKLVAMWVRTVVDELAAIPGVEVAG